MPAPAEIIQLVELFERNYNQYRAPEFSEAAVQTNALAYASYGLTPEEIAVVAGAGPTTNGERINE